MNSHLLAATVLSFAATAAPAQQLTEVVGLDSLLAGAPTEPIWSQTTSDSLAGLRWEEGPGEFTLLMVHATVDANVAGDIVAAGIEKALPFMVSPVGAGWGPSHPFFDEMKSDGYSFSGEALMIPPERVVSQIKRLVSGGYQTGFVSHNSGAAAITRYASAGMVNLPVGSDPADELQPWAQSAWLSAEQNPFGFDAFYGSQLGHAAVFQAAHEFVARYNLAPLDEVGVEVLNGLMEYKLGFEIFVQPITVTPANGSDPIHIKYKRHTGIRRHSLFGDTGSSYEWALRKGGPRWVPDLQDARFRTYLAPLGDEMHIEFATPMSSLARPAPLRAYVPTVGGGYTIVAQTPNPILHGEVLRPEVAIFPCPPNATFGVMLIEDTAVPMQPLLPLGATGLGAEIWVYVTPQ